ncbi:MAG: hypothetical protein RIS34_2509 [Pseudomonadota bacterium]|jgi:hypothetical protein
MLRLAVLFLLLSNAVYYAWTHELLKAYGFAPAQQSEPQRLAQQIRPEALRILVNGDLPTADTLVPAAVPRPPECLQAGLFDDTQTALLRQALEAALPVGTWQLDPVVEPARWIVYMGKYADAQALAVKRAQLASLNLKFEPLVNPTLEFGLSLGAYETRGAAEARLESLKQRGVHTARVLEERPRVQGATLRMAAVDDALRVSLDALKPALAGKPLRSCK